MDERIKVGSIVNDPRHKALWLIGKCNNRLCYSRLDHEHAGSMIFSNTEYSPSELTDFWKDCFSDSFKYVGDLCDLGMIMEEKLNER